MNVISKNIPVHMARMNLEGIPQYPMPSGYSVRWYRAGDDKTWLAIWLASERLLKITPDLNAREFGTDSTVLSQRQCFLLDPRQTPVGTATAWFDNNYKGLSWGRLHWVAITSSLQGRGLARALLTVVCNRMKELGHERAYLATSSARVPAINLYLRFGFVPEIRNADDSEVWNSLRPYVTHPLSF
jgi:GNAT superfamily N-acetyltransferase